MKYFVVHHPVLTERRALLEEQFEKFGIKDEDVEWVTSFPPEEARKIKEYTQTPLPVSYVSGNMKHYSILQKMVREDIPEAIIFEDDVILMDHFDPEKIPREYAYVKLEAQPELMNILHEEDFSKTLFISNNAGVAGYYVRKEFAEVFVKNINLRHAMDLEIQNVLYHYFDCPVVTVFPTCYQPQSGSSIVMKEGDALPEKWKVYVLTKWKKTYTFDELVSVL